MGIKLPEELADVAQRAGVRWPEADEDQMRSLAEAWRAAAAAVRESRTDAHGHVEGAFESYEGDAADAAREHWELFVAEDGRFSSIVRGCEEAAAQLEFAADQIAATKVEIIRRLVKLAVRTDAAEQAAADGDASAEAELDSLFAGAKAEFAEVNQTLAAAVDVEAGEALPDVVTDEGDMSAFQPLGTTAGELLDPDLAALLGIDPDAVLPELGDRDGGEGDEDADPGEEDGFDDAPPLVLSELVNSMVESGELARSDAGELAENRGFTWGDDLIEQQEAESGGLSPAELRDLDPESTGPIPAGVVDQAARAATPASAAEGGGPPVYSPPVYTPDPSMNTGPINIPAGPGGSAGSGGYGGGPGGHGGGSGGGGSAAPAAPAAPGLTPSFSGPPPEAAPAPVPRPEAPAPSAPPAQNMPPAPGPQAPAGPSGGGGQAPPASGGGAGQPQAPGRPMPVLPGPGAPGGMGLPGGPAAPGVPGAPVSPGAPGGIGGGAAVPGAGAPGAAAPGAAPPAKLPPAGGLPGLGGAPAPHAPGVPGLAAGPGASAAPGLGGAPPAGGGAMVAHVAGGGPVAGKSIGPMAQGADLFGGAPADQNAAGRAVRPTQQPDAELLAFTMNLFPLGHLPVPSTRPARQLPAPPRETDFAPGIRFPPQDHPQSELVDLRSSVSKPAPEQQGTCPPALLSGHDPLGDLHERAWDRRFVVRAAATGHGAPAEYAWPPGELFPEGAADPAGSEAVVLAAGTALDRLGTPEGRVLAEADTRFATRSLPPGYADRPYARYVVQRPLPAWRAVSAPWFAQPGGGLRFRLTQSVAELLRAGYLAVDEDAPAARVSATVADIPQTVPQA